jgi:hypothetical protein
MLSSNLNPIPHKYYVSAVKIWQRLAAAKAAMETFDRNEYCSSSFFRRCDQIVIDNADFIPQINGVSIEVVS